MPPGLQNDFSVRLRGEADPFAAQDVAQLAVVVQLAVVAQMQAALDERLIRRSRQIDDRQSPVAELH
jgi:hypothetical protein